MRASDPKIDTEYLADIDSAGEEKSGVVKHLGTLGRNDKIVEIGPGGGAALRIIMARIAELDEESRPLVSVLDISAEVLQKIQELLEELGTHGRYETKIGDISKHLPYEDGSVHAVNLSSVLHECFSYGGGEEGIKTFIKELNRILAVGGIVVYRDMNGVETRNPSSFRLKTELGRKFMEIFFAKYFDRVHTRHNKPNHHYLENLEITDEPDGRRITCDAGLSHEFKRHLIVFITTLLPETMYTLETQDSGTCRITFAKEKGKRKFKAFLQENQIEYQESPLGLDVASEAMEKFQSTIDQEVHALFSDCEIIMENEEDSENISGFLSNLDVNNRRQDKRIVVALKDLVVIYSKFRQYMGRQNMQAVLANERQEKLLDWFEREGEESYFYGDQTDVITKFLEYSITDEAENSMLGHTCLVPMGMDEIAVTERQRYTSYVLEQVDDIEGSYEDGKNLITFVKRPVEYVIPTILALYKKTGDIRIIESLRRIIDIIHQTLQSPVVEQVATDRLINAETGDHTEVIFGLIGGIASGKSTAAESFRESGFEVIELSNFIREQILALGIENPTRDDYFETGNAMRRESGNGIFSQLGISEIEKRGLKRAIISGIRTPEDVTNFRKRFPSFQAIAVDTPLDVRIKRITDRMRDIDPRDRAKMIADIDREWEDVVEEGCKLKQTIAMADIRIDGSQNIESMKEQCIALASQSR